MAEKTEAEYARAQSTRQRLHQFRQLRTQVDELSKQVHQTVMHLEGVSNVNTGIEQMSRKNLPITFLNALDEKYR